MRHLLFAATLASCLPLLGCAARCPEPSHAPVPQDDAIVIGQSFVMDSAALGEKRRITVYLPPGYAESRERYPVMYLLDGGAAEDFHHITGIVQVSVANEIMRPLIVIGIENTERRRDLTGPTENEKDKTIAPRVGGSARFRAFLKNELVPRIERDYRSSGERGLMGESLAGLFVLETFFEDPALFGTYLAVSPSLWWNDGFLLARAEPRLKVLSAQGKTLYLTVGGVEDNTEETERMAGILRQHAPAGLIWHYVPFPAEAHGTVYHVGAVHALRLLYARKKTEAGGGG
ncbi:alpha/beta hydrolase [Polyangium jinanense]|uniref:Alpha/beta hydrolase n=1 Tax=Polyangium jinanense TaxID=2829994 RepID=A0A9X3X5I4_9BACT|nr:alpha/beta hydrolase-fold protein [Polyangium jinanense]MDC3959713.1 alpha/beta hydrolase [Polyangium jinanense]MDC3984119.1 alpha/beta hydrolase [Polyangium jinanense]